MDVAKAFHKNSFNLGSVGLGLFFLAWLAGASPAAPANPDSSPESLLRNSGVVPPKLTGGPWLNLPRGTSLSLASLRGRVTVVHFWTFDCINCQHNLPYYAQWQKQFAPRGLTIIGIHTPETPTEHELTNVVAKVKQLGITYPVLVDADAQNWKRWQQRCWPTVYLLDKRGRARVAWEGELEYQGKGGYAKLTRMIEELLKE
jgi:thiol-disulfide isomerase/thioredoxin